jgi:hypothetical protein
VTPGEATLRLEGGPLIDPLLDELELACTGPCDDCTLFDRLPDPPEMDGLEGGRGFVRDSKVD